MMLNRLLSRSISRITSGNSKRLLVNFEGKNSLLLGEQWGVSRAVFRPSSIRLHASFSSSNSLTDSLMNEASEIRVDESCLNGDFLASTGFKMAESELTAKNEMEDVVILRKLMDNQKVQVEVLFNALEGVGASGGTMDDAWEEDDDYVDDDLDEDEEQADDDDEAEEDDEDFDEVDDGERDVNVLIKINRLDGAHHPTLFFEVQATSAGMLCLESFWFEEAESSEQEAEIDPFDPTSMSNTQEDDIFEVKLDDLSPAVDEQLYVYLESLGIDDDLAVFVQDYCLEFEASKTANALEKLSHFIDLK